jgi:broad specificity phosphatase PhoE
LQDFYLIRHGETDWNVKTRRFQGHTDIELNEVGVQQAEELKGLISPFGIDLFVSSDLKRAQKTALILADDKKSCLVDPRLREVHLGSAEGMTPEQVDEANGPDFRKRWSEFNEGALDMRYPGGESRREVVERFLQSIHYHLNHNMERTIAFVSHGFIIRSFIYACSPQSSEFLVPNCSVLPFRRDPSNGIIKYVGPANIDDLVRSKIKTIL